LRADSSIEQEQRRTRQGKRPWTLALKVAVGVRPGWRVTMKMLDGFDVSFTIVAAARQAISDKR
jgi:hypothetical protein